jgi:hypothetical protein
MMLGVHRSRPVTAVILAALLALPFDPPFAVTADGRVIDLPEGARPTYANSFPWFGDLDRDGKPDLLVGQSRSGKERGGQLRVYRNTGERGKPRFGAFAWFDESVPTGRIPDG